MKLIGFSRQGRTAVLGLSAILAAAAIGAGCGSDSNASATFPRTPTAGLEIRVVTPPPTATAVPEP
jgi:hypothetical protein